MGTRTQSVRLGLTAALLLGASSAAAQAPLPNVFDGGAHWRIFFFVDAAPNHQSQAIHDICFLPYTEVNGILQGSWFSTTFADWNGRYYQEGDEVKMTADFLSDRGHDHMTLLHTTFDGPGSPGMAFKDWTEWLENGAFGVAFFGNAKMERLGECPAMRGAGVSPPPKGLPEIEREMLEESRLVPERLTTRGQRATGPVDPDLESLEIYLRRTGR